MEDIAKFINDQLSVWPLAAANFRALKSIDVRELQIGGLCARVQYNPCRIVSSTAEIDPATIAARKCFLCQKNRPAEQKHIKFEGRKGRKYNIQVNPYPIFQGHLVIAREEHVPQAIWHHLPDMLDFAKCYREYAVYYNGPYSGASAPDHLHFQACPMGMLPLQTAVDSFLDHPGKHLTHVQEAYLYHYQGYTRGVYCLKADTAKSLTKLFYQFLDCCPMREGDTEPRFNLYAWYHCAPDAVEGEYRLMAVLRTEIRSHHYYAQDEEHLAISPGAAEMAGVFVAPMEEDFNKVTAVQLEQMLAEVSITKEEEDMIEWRLSRRQPKLEVGIMSAPEITFEIISDGAGPQRVSVTDGRLNYNGELYDELVFDSVTRSTLFAEPSFILYGVTIGIDFHWQRRQNQKFAGSLKFIVENGLVTAINKVGVENYLLSVISSEMKASSTLEFLKAHAVISRSWVMSHIGHRAAGEHKASEFHGIWEDGTPSYVRWWDHDDHVNFDVCADDHCQRYQGLTNAVGDNVRKAIDETWGQVLCYDGQICDARFYKCCGGMMETFDTCWEDAPHPYLQAVPDTAPEGGDAFCNTNDEAILSQVLNDYDLETKDFFEWEVRYTQEELSNLVKSRSGMDFGTIEDLIPLKRGGSGRIFLLKIVGSKQSLVIGKELVIRRWLSDSHLKSSAFDVERDGTDFILKGKGWGHGVGLCQIGAAVMSYRGYDYKEILSHYYPGASLERR